MWLASAGILRLATDPSGITHKECLEESSLVLFQCVEELLIKADIQPQEVCILHPNAVIGLTRPASTMHGSTRLAV